jgi:hypothetical protein
MSEPLSELTAIMNEQDSIEKKTNELRRLTLAMRCFRGASELCKHAIELQLTENDPLYSPCLTGIVVTYARPFSGADGIGTLSSNFTNFADPDFSSADRELCLARQRFHAHYDAIRVHDLEIRDHTELEPYATNVEFRADADGKVRIYPWVNVPEITPDSLPGLEKLFSFQMDRVFAAQTAVLKSLASGKSYGIGKYTLGIYFP